MNDKLEQFQKETAELIDLIARTDDITEHVAEIEEKKEIFDNLIQSIFGEDVAAEADPADLKELFENTDRETAELIRQMDKLPSVADMLELYEPLPSVADMIQESEQHIDEPEQAGGKANSDTDT